MDFADGYRAQFLPVEAAGESAGFVRVSPSKNPQFFRNSFVICKTSWVNVGIPLSNDANHPEEPLVRIPMISQPAAADSCCLNIRNSKVAGSSAGALVGY